MNPWGLSQAQERAMRAVIEHGGQKQAAYALNVSLKTVEAHVAATRRKMSTQIPPQQGHLAHFIAFDRWDRQQNAERTDQ